MLISDNAKAQISGPVKEILGTLGINNRTSEPHNKNQNFGKRGYRDTKRMTNHLLNFSGTPGYAWLLALQYSCFVINHLASERLGWRTPAEWLTGSTPDITALLFFVFFQPRHKAPPRHTRRISHIFGVTYGSLAQDHRCMDHVCQAGEAPFEEVFK